MILVAESGSTKTQWNILDNNNIKSITNTQGINPVVMNVEEMIVAMRPVLSEVDPKELDSIYFFGAGCAGDELKQKVGTAIFDLFKTENIFIDSDMIAACLSLAGDKPAIVCILGTGSNSCLWSGDHIAEQTPSLGYILGDEGGGVSIGRQLVADFLKKQMPNDLRLLFSEQYHISTEIAIERVYRSPQPNAYLASFAPFALKYIDSDYCKKLMEDIFASFITRNVMKYSNISNTKLYFCGSIAWAFAETLSSVCSTLSLEVGEIKKEPMQGLCEYIMQRRVTKQE